MQRFNNLIKATLSKERRDYCSPVVLAVKVQGNQVPSEGKGRQGGFACRFLQLERRAVPMDKLNSQLYLQNCYIIQQNEKLRKKAHLLNQENQALLSELQQRLSKANSKPNTSSDFNLGSNSVQNATNHSSKP
ncbi:hypothetical protein HS088_TW09G00665 [Tripterygium wilfordii]|uniref:Uncharacterized protein n=1 Tax=Tripterygium wilfordii TaxID=458696 RepID=A0A7J7D8H6_TRIWF|nr:hypothetical protein HS088_TW09G00665 [Tripterygium wilfordii]